jgi:hypothetical protein
MAWGPCQRKFHQSPQHRSTSITSHLEILVYCEHDNILNFPNRVFKRVIHRPQDLPTPSHRSATMGALLTKNELPVEGRVSAERS